MVNNESCTFQIALLQRKKFQFIIETLSIYSFLQAWLDSNLQKMGLAKKRRCEVRLQLENPHRFFKHLLRSIYKNVAILQR